MGVHSYNCQREVTYLFHNKKKCEYLNITLNEAHYANQLLENFSKCKHTTLTLPSMYPCSIHQPDEPEYTVPKHQPEKFQSTYYMKTVHNTQYKGIFFLQLLQPSFLEGTLHRQAVTSDQVSYCKRGCLPALLVKTQFKTQTLPRVRSGSQTQSWLLFSWQNKTVLQSPTQSPDKQKCTG